MSPVGRLGRPNGKGSEGERQRTVTTSEEEGWGHNVMKALATIEDFQFLPCICMNVSSLFCECIFLGIAANVVSENGTHDGWLSRLLSCS